MKKYFKRISSIIVTFFIVINFSFALNVQAKTTNDVYKNAATDLLRKMNCSKDIEGEIQLYDASGKQSYNLYQLKQGYIIVDKTTADVSEFNLKDSNKYYTNKFSHYIYGGPLSYYAEKDNKLIDLNTNNVVKNKDRVKTGLNNKKNKYLSKCNGIKSLLQSVNKNIKITRFNIYRMGGTYPNYDYNPNGICGSCACGNLLEYFNLNCFNNSLIPAKYSPGEKDGKTLIRSIVPYVDGKDALNPDVSGGASPSDLKDGLAKYITSELHWNRQVSLDKSSMAPKLTRRGLPYVLGLTSEENPDNFYGDHWVVGLGVISTGFSPNEHQYYEVVNGWGENNVTVKQEWTDYVVWVQ